MLEWLRLIYLTTIIIIRAGGEVTVRHQVTPEVVPATAAVVIPLVKTFNLFAPYVVIPSCLLSLLDPPDAIIDPSLLCVSPGYVISFHRIHPSTFSSTP